MKALCRGLKGPDETSCIQSKTSQDTFNRGHMMWVTFQEGPCGCGDHGVGKQRQGGSQLKGEHMEAPQMTGMSLSPSHIDWDGCC